MIRLSRLAGYCLRYRPYLLAVMFFLALFVVWACGRAMGFPSLHSLLAGTGLFLLLSAAYVLLLYRAPSPAAVDNGVDPALPWYLLIGQPGAGKSSLIAHAGMNFILPESPSGDSAPAVPGCACFVSNEAVVLDTSGHSMTHSAAAGEWNTWLRSLGQQRPHLPLNGLIVAVGIDDLLHGCSEELALTARRLRQRIQQCAATLETRLPVYLVFTKCDLVPGFSGFPHEGDAPHTGVMGVTFSHEGYAQDDWSQRFDAALEDLLGYWRQVARQRLIRQDIQITRQNDAAYRFPVELAALQPRLKQFVSTLRQANPYQPVELLRGFYFTAARDAGEVSSGNHGQHVARRFALQACLPRDTQGDNLTAPRLIEGLLRKVIIPDQHLVTHYSHNHRERRRKRIRIATASLAAAVLCSLWGWSWYTNATAMRTLSVELAQAIRADQQAPGAYTAWHSLDRLRVGAHSYYQQHHELGVPLKMRLGLYRGHVVEALLREAYFDRLRQVMLQPVSENLARTLYLLTTLKVYQRNTPQLAPISGVDSVEATALPQDNRAQSIANFGSAALDTYRMLSAGHSEMADSSILKARLPDYWYPAIARHPGQTDAARDHLYASRQIEFYSEQIHAADAPRILDNAFLISSSRNYIDSLLSHSLRAPETITLESDTLFAFGRADFQSLASTGQGQLNAIASKLLSTADIDRIVITGHADQLGDPQGNLAVSLQRAKTIRTYLIGKGIPAERITARGEGSRKPLVRCDTQQPRTLLIRCLEPNRRVEIEVRRAGQGRTEATYERASREARSSVSDFH